MVSTKQCCWGECKSDASYPEKLPKYLQEMMAPGEKVFLPFPKPSQGLEKCKRWILVCSRENFTVQNINRNTCICVLHCPGRRGPTEEFPDTLKANFTEREIEKFSSMKRRRPRLKTAQDQEPQQKRLKLFDDSKSFDSFSRQELEDICSEMKGSYTENEKSSGVGSTENNPTGSASDVGTQTEISRYLQVSAKIDTMLLRNEVALMKTDQKRGSKVVSSIYNEAIANDSALMKHFVGLSSEQFEVLHNFLNSVCPLDEITRLNGKEDEKIKRARRCSEAWC